MNIDCSRRRLTRIISSVVVRRRLLLLLRCRAVGAVRRVLRRLEVVIRRAGVRRLGSRRVVDRLAVWTQMLDFSDYLRNGCHLMEVQRKKKIVVFSFNKLANGSFKVKFNSLVAQGRINAS